jgi:hypothetical protein
MPLNPIIVKEIAGLVMVAGVVQTIWTPAAGKKFRLCGYHVGVSAAASVLFKEGAGNTSIGIRSALIGANLGDSSDNIGDGDGILSAAADNPLKLDVTANATVHGWVWGFEE